MRTWETHDGQDGQDVDVNVDSDEREDQRGGHDDDDQWNSGEALVENTSDRFITGAAEGLGMQLMTMVT